MAGFALQRSKMTLEFEKDHDLHGLEVECNLDIPLSVFLEFQDNIGQAEEEGSKALRRAFEIFANDVLVSWNFTNDSGKTIPANRDGFFELSPRIASSIMTNWSSSVSEVPDPLEEE
jgi:hypothetical protein